MSDAARRAAEFCDRVLSVAPTLPPGVALASIDMAQAHVDLARVAGYTERLQRAREEAKKRASS